METVEVEVDQKEPLKVVFAGFARSGSHSLSNALEQIGYRSCHGQDTTANILGTHKKLALAMMNHNIDGIIQETSLLGCNATMELHSVFWRALFEATPPETKFVFIVRDYEKWKASVQGLLRAMAPVNRYPLRFIPMFDMNYKLALSLTAYSNNLSPEQAREFMIHPGTPQQDVYMKRAHDEFVQQAHELTSLYPDRALLFDLKQGFPPLCQFLEIDNCPTTPFPHLGAQQELQRQGMLLRAMEVMLYVVPTVIVLAMVRSFVGTWRVKTSKKRQDKTKQQ